MATKIGSLITHTNKEITEFQEKCDEYVNYEQYWRDMQDRVDFSTQEHMWDIYEARARFYLGLRYDLIRKYIGSV